LHDLLLTAHVFPGLELYYAGPAQPLTTAGKELDNLQQVMIYLICVIVITEFSVELAPILRYEIQAVPAFSSLSWRPVL